MSPPKINENIFFLFSEKTKIRRDSNINCKYSFFKKTDGDLNLFFGVESVRFVTARSERSFLRFD